MVELSPALARRLRVITASAGGRADRELSGGDATRCSLGENPRAYIDELLAQPNRELYDALENRSGRRSQPLMILATTADNDPARPPPSASGASAADAELDRRRLVVLHAAPPDADWKREETPQLANPALGEYLDPEVLRAERNAIDNPAEERSPASTASTSRPRTGRAVDLTRWDAALQLRANCARKPVRLLDLASTIDLASYALDPLRRRGHDMLLPAQPAPDRAGSLTAARRAGAGRYRCSP